MFSFQQKSRKKPPPRPPPPNLLKLKSKSTLNLAAPPAASLIEWSPPRSPRPHQFGGSVSSSHSSSASSLTSSKRSFEEAATFRSHVRERSPPRPRIIRAAPPRRAASPPMPRVPPPGPPTGETSVITPYGIALFEFAGAQPGDLPLQVNDVVILVRKVNNEWLYGKVCDREGMFPASFIQVEVPLPGEYFVTALYAFQPQLAGDLALKPGQKVRVLREVSNEWLFGECEGQSGQFPKNFVI